MNKNVSVGFYYLNLTITATSPDLPEGTIEDFIPFFVDAMNNLSNQTLVERRIEYPNKNKTLWMDSFEVLDNRNYNMIFKSLKYNYRRNVRNNSTMDNLGILKGEFDGDEERTHLCIRHNKGCNTFLCMFEKNYNGIGISQIVNYLYHKMKNFADISNHEYRYSFSSDFIPDEGFLAKLNLAKKFTLLKLTVERNSLDDKYLQFADRDDMSEYVDIIFKRKGRKSPYISKDAIKRYYNLIDNNENEVKRLCVKSGGDTILDTEQLKKKEKIIVETTSDTNEVDSADFFQKAQQLLEQLKLE